MSSHANKYDYLLDYLEKQQKEQKSTIPKDVTKVIDTPKIEKTTKIEKPKPSIKQETYKKLKNFTHIIPKRESKGFSILRFEEAMRQKLTEQFQASQDYERPYISITELFSCLRKTYYVRMKYQIQLSKMFSYPYLYLVNKVGNSLHDATQAIYGFDKNEHTVISKEYKVKGRVDAIEGNNLIEIKTLDPNDFKNTYNPLHYIQGNVGAFILNNDYDYNIDNITIVYISRTCKKIEPFDIDYNESEAKKYLQNGLILRHALDTNQVPDPINKTEEECKYCLYKTHCSKKQEGKRKSVFLL